MDNINLEFYTKGLDNIYDGVYFIDHNKNIIYWNQGAERITGFRRSEVLGVHCSEDILTYSEGRIINLCKGQCPLAETMKDGLMRESEVYLQHKDGHKVSVSMRAVPMRDNDGNIAGLIEIFSDNAERLACTERLKELEEVSLIDTATGLANKKYIEINLNSRFSEMRRYGWPFGIIFMDTDSFRKINERYGSEAGDMALKTISKTLLASSRPFDVVGRWQADKFVAVIVNVDENKLYIVANRLLDLVEQSKIFVGQDTIHATLSTGATIAQPEDTIETLMGRANEMAERSKSLGGNRLTMKLE